MTMIPKTIQIDVVFPLPDEQRVFSTNVPEGTTVQQAIEASGILGWYPQIDLTQQKVGIFAKLTALTQIVSDQDRIEIYRPVLSSYNLPMGYVIVGMDTTAAKRQQMFYLAQLVAIMALLTIVATIFFMTIINRSIIRPINTLSAAAENYVATVNKNPDTSPLSNLSIHTGDEIEKLFYSILKMESDIFNSSSNLAIAVWNSQHDSMTQLYNKGYLNDSRSAYESNKSLGVIYFDVDNLKKMNDTCGHEAGDEVILKTARFIQKYQTEDRVGFRMGGDEFMLVVPNISDTDIDSLVNKMKADPDTHLCTPEQPIQCRIAIGYAYCEGNIDLERLIKIADDDMYLDKKSHR